MSAAEKPAAVICPIFARALFAVLMDARERLEDESTTADAKRERLKAVGRISALETLMYEIGVDP